MIAVATGASSGIGRAIALALADAGASPFLVGRHISNLESTARDARKKTDRVWVCPTDLLLENETRKLVDIVLREAKGLDILILCTGVYGRGRIDESTADRMDELYRSNVRAPYFLVKALLPLLAARQGQIVFVNSSSGVRARAMSGQFSATQHALRAMADALREEVNPSGVRVLSLFPGRTATPRMKALYAAEQKPYRPEVLMQPEDVATMIIQALCLPHTAEVTEIHMRPLQKSY